MSSYYDTEREGIPQTKRSGQLNGFTCNFCHGRGFTPCGCRGGAEVSRADVSARDTRTAIKSAFWDLTPKNANGLLGAI